MGKLYELILNKMNINVEFICDKIDYNVKQKLYSDYAEALDNETIDGLIVATHATSHYEIINYAIDKKIKFIVCEKPFTTSARSAKLLFEKVKNSETRLVVNYTRRFSKAYEKLYHILYHDKILGQPKSMSIFCGAGGLSAVGTHFFDLFCYILDAKPISVYAVTVDKNLPNPRGMEFQDPGGYVLLNFENEKRAFLDMGDDLGLQPMIEIVCEYGRLFIDEINKTIHIRGRIIDEQKIPKHLYGTKNIVLNDDSFNFEPLEQLIQNMITNLISSELIIVTPEMASEKVEIYSAIRKSFDTGNLVTLPLNDEYDKKEFAVT